MRYYIFSILFLFSALSLSQLSAAQWVSIDSLGGQPDGSAALEINSKERGVLIPRMTSGEMNAIPVPALGLLVFNTTIAAFYYYDGSNWVEIPTNGADDLGNHTATQNIELNGFSFSDDGDNEGISISTSGVVSFTPATTGAGSQAIRTSGDIWTTGQGTGLYMTNSGISITGNNGNSGDLRLSTGGTSRVRVTSGGNVGVGTNNPSERLEVNGVAQAGNFKYTSPDTRYLHVPNTAWNPLTNTGVDNLSWGNGGIFVWMESSTQNQAQMSVPLYLPDGATITSLRARMNNTGTNNMSMSLYRYDGTGALGTALASINQNGTSGLTTYFDNTINNSVVDNQTYFYYLIYEADATPNFVNAVYGVRITYTVNNPD